MDPAVLGAAIGAGALVVIAGTVVLIRGLTSGSAAREVSRDATPPPAPTSSAATIEALQRRVDDLEARERTKTAEDTRRDARLAERDARTREQLAKIAERLRIRAARGDDDDRQSE